MNPFSRERQDSMYDRDLDDTFAQVAEEKAKLQEEIEKQRAIEDGLLIEEFGIRNNTETWVSGTFSQWQRDQVINFIQAAPAMLNAKGADYADEADAYSNFRFAGMIMDFATVSGLHGPDLAFMNHVATKLARLCNLIGSGSAPRNEALEDTFRDLINYTGLWAGYQNNKHEEL